MYFSPVLALLIGATFWGLSWWPFKYFNAAGLGSNAFLLIVYGSICLTLLPFAWRARQQWRHQGGILLALVVLGGYSNIAFANAIIFGDVIRMMLLFYLAPVWAVIGARIFLNEHADRQRWLCVVIACFGAFLILGGRHLDFSNSSVLDLLALTAGMGFALTNVTCRRAQQLTIINKTFIIFFGGVLAAGFALLILQQSIPSTIPLQLGASLLGFSLLWILLGSLATQWGVTHMDAGRSGVILVSELVIAAISATLLGADTLSLEEAIGGGLIIAATIFEAQRSSKSPKMRTK